MPDNGNHYTRHDLGDPLGAEGGRERILTIWCRTTWRRSTSFTGRMSGKGRRRSFPYRAEIGSSGGAKRADPADVIYHGATAAGS